MAGRDERRSGILASVGRDRSSIICLRPIRCFRALIGRLRRKGNCLFEDKFSFSSGNAGKGSKSSGKRGAKVVRGESPKVGMVSFSLATDGGVGIARKDKSCRDGLLSMRSNRSKTGRPVVKRSFWCVASFEGLYESRGIRGGDSWDLRKASMEVLRLLTGDS